eukprot:TRINITY_DN48773_c0_g1_i1.p1 TRINITY_DN48773_c0_g1~~TRINITY_DN48773_c0_g1_i1.p1  ORF type:complete len:542 (+),score=56.35 TRINITY_DN48773_c0_g1_i1:27-1652(+)
MQSVLSCFGLRDPVVGVGKEKGTEKEPFVIKAENTFRNRWDLLLFCVVVVTGFVVPLRIGFRLEAWKGWLGCDILTDCLLIADVFICALTTYEVDGEVIRDRRAILRNYLRTWLFFDVVSVLPLELLAIFYRYYTPLFRVNRLARMIRLTYYFSQWEKVTSLKPSVIRIFKSTFVIVFLAHFIGCGFFLVILIEEEDAQKDFTGTENIRSKGLGSQYIRAFYWSFVTMTGYNNTNPHTQLETLFSIFVTMVGISLFATIIGTVGSLVTNLDSSALYFRQKMDGINDYMKYKRIPQDLQNEVRNYYTYLWKSGKGLDKNKVLDDLPPYLKNKMSVILNSEIIKKVPLFRQCKDDTEFINEIVKCLKPRVCLPNSFVVRKGEVGNEMFFISRGELNVVSDDDKVVFTLKDGGFFGEIALLYDTKRTASIVARTYCDMFVLTKDDFKKVMKKFPQQSDGIKTIAKERFQSIVDADNEKKQEQQASSGSQRAPAAMNTNSAPTPPPPAVTAPAASAPPQTSAGSNAGSNAAGSDGKEDSNGASHG